MPGVCDAWPLASLFVQLQSVRRRRGRGGDGGVQMGRHYHAPFHPLHLNVAMATDGP